MGMVLGEKRLNVCCEWLILLAVLSKTVCSVFLGMGESNCAWNRKALLHRDTMLAAAAVYGGKGAERPFPPCLTGEPMPCHVCPFELPGLFPFL